MPVAIIDIGTNTVHLMVADADAQAPGGLRVLAEEREPVRLGRPDVDLATGATVGGITQGELAPGAMARALYTLASYARQAGAFGIAAGDIYCYATSAVRTARNGAAFVALVAQELGISIQVVDGRREAELIFAGIAASGALPVGEVALVLDIGGGSVECILGRAARGVGQAAEVLWLHSFELGAQRLLDGYVDTDPIRPARAVDLIEEITLALEPLAKACRTFGPSMLVGASGSFDTLADMQAAHLGKADGEPEWLFQAIDLPFFRQATALLQSIDRPARLALPGMTQMRVDMMVVATLLTEAVLALAGIGQMRACRWALKEGAFFEALPLG